MERGANNKLSLAASAIWRMRTADPDPMGDPSGDAGDLIEAHERAYVLKAVAAAGFYTPGEYNAELRSRLGLDGKLFPGKAGFLLMILEIDHVCPVCGEALNVHKIRTKNYGGGWDTFEACPNCSYAEVYV